MSLLRSMAVGLVLSVFWVGSGQAAIITHGYLTTDDSTNYITDTQTGRQYTRFDAFNLSYADTLLTIGTSGAFEGWTIASDEIAAEFVSASLGVNNSLCTGTLTSNTYCGTLVQWTDGDFGQSWTANFDDFAYIKDPQADHVGIMQIESATGDIWELGNTSWTTSHIDDFSSLSWQNTVNFLLYKDVQDVPEPTSIALMGLGLVGLGFARKKKTV